MKNRIIEICELGQPQSIIHRENEPITELIKTEVLIKELNEAINYTHSCTELKTVKQGENLILDNKFDVEVITPESSVLIKHKDKDRLIWVDKQRLKRK